MLYANLFLALLVASYLFWRYWYIPKEVVYNVEAFKANGSADDLQQGYHSRQVWKRTWPCLACCIVPIIPLAFTGWLAPLLGFFAGAALLVGAFARDFTPLLNLARYAAGEKWIVEWGASPASKSWPDAASWVQIRKNHYATDAEEQQAANDKMRAIVLHAWYGCLVSSFVLASAAVHVSLHNH